MGKIKAMKIEWKRYHWEDKFWNQLAFFYKVEDVDFNDIEIRINGKVYTEYSEEFEHEFNKVQMWNHLVRKPKLDKLTELADLLAKTKEKK